MKIPVKIYALLVWFVISILMVLAIAACNHTFVHLDENLTSEPSCHMIQHAAGETCIPHDPTRLITLSQLTLANAIALGVKPIGSASALNFELNDFPTYVKGETKEIRLLGQQGNPNLEKILQLKPDLILGWEPDRKIYPLLAQIAPAILGKWKGPPSWREHFSFVAEALGKEEAAQQVWEHYYQRTKLLKAALGNQYEGKTISVISVSEGRGIIVSTKNSFEGSILNDVGLQRPQAQDVIAPLGRFTVSEEKLEEADGDILFVALFDSRGRKMLENLQKKPLWKTLKSVQQNKVYLVEQLTWGGSNLLAADAVIDDLYKYLVNTP
ncbi:iron-siderophore ABC transporter substrate-binding protein [Myxacorys almedinensis]|uniref:ABC transporter substrate-binding protein n=1 Tax=Myxacorys almedinensis A TaxID=2690445 RepID=A0A8J7Z5Q7_9CYAN|nr:iron-siderophore ABC transporter substrate-binding protein [Myxacorys almedinensis]NDJ15975.1 ABC transporter substrate-binding protein [Myxacorys almedinensis A]